MPTTNDRRARRSRGRCKRHMLRETVSRPLQASHATRLASRLCLVLSSAIHMTHSWGVVSRDINRRGNLVGAEFGALLSGRHVSQVCLSQCHELSQASIGRTGAPRLSLLGASHRDRHITSALCIYRDGQWDELRNRLYSVL